MNSVLKKTVRCFVYLICIYVGGHEFDVLIL